MDSRLQEGETIENRAREVLGAYFFPIHASEKTAEETLEIMLNKFYINCDLFCSAIVYYDSKYKNHKKAREFLERYRKKPCILKKKLQENQEARKVIPSIYSKIYSYLINLSSLAYHNFK